MMNLMGSRFHEICSPDDLTPDKDLMERVEQVFGGASFLLFEWFCGTDNFGK